MHTTLKSALVAIPAFAAALASPAIAAPVSTSSIAVRYGDLNLATSDGRAVLDRRIERAVETVCGRTSTVNIAMNAKIADCSAAARSAAKAATAAAIMRAGTKVASR